MGYKGLGEKGILASYSSGGDGAIPIYYLHLDRRVQVRVRGELLSGTLSGMFGLKQGSQKHACIYPTFLGWLTTLGHIFAFSHLYIEHIVSLDRLAKWQHI